MTSVEKEANNNTLPGEGRFKKEKIKKTKSEKMRTEKLKGDKKISNKIGKTKLKSETGVPELKENLIKFNNKREETKSSTTKRVYLSSKENRFKTENYHSSKEDKKSKKRERPRLEEVLLPDASKIANQPINQEPIIQLTRKKEEIQIQPQSETNNEEKIQVEHEHEIPPPKYQIPVEEKPIEIQLEPVDPPAPLNNTENVENESPKVEIEEIIVESVILENEVDIFDERKRLEDPIGDDSDSNSVSREEIKKEIEDYIEESDSILRKVPTTRVKVNKKYKQGKIQFKKKLELELVGSGGTSISSDISSAPETSSDTSRRYNYLTYNPSFSEFDTTESSDFTGGFDHNDLQHTNRTFSFEPEQEQLLSSNIKDILLDSWKLRSSTHFSVSFFSIQFFQYLEHESYIFFIFIFLYFYIFIFLYFYIFIFILFYFLEFFGICMIN